MEVVYIREMHLGDFLAILNLAYSRAQHNQKPIQVYGPEMILTLFGLFDYNGLIYMGCCPRQFVYTDNIISLMPRFENGPIAGNKASVNFLFATMLEHVQDGYEAINKIELPPVKSVIPSKEDIVGFQFDSRSLHVGKPPVDANEGEQIITLYRDNIRKVIGLGGHETKPYLNYEFRLGHLEHILENMMICSKFIGVDSGLSHLAGTAKVTSDIVIIHVREQHYLELEAFYHSMYPTATCHRRPYINKTQYNRLFL